MGIQRCVEAISDDLAAMDSLPKNKVNLGVRRGHAYIGRVVSSDSCRRRDRFLTNHLILFNYRENLAMSYFVG